MMRFERGGYHVGETVAFMSGKRASLGEVVRFRACDGFMIAACGDFLILFEGKEYWVDATFVWSANETEKREAYIEELARLAGKYAGDQIVSVLIQIELNKVLNDRPSLDVLKLLKPEEETCEDSP